jgi:hypothetical protein
MDVGGTPDDKRGIGASALPDGATVRQRTRVMLFFVAAAALLAALFLAVQLTRPHPARPLQNTPDWIRLDEPPAPAAETRSAAEPKATEAARDEARRP